MVGVQKGTGAKTGPANQLTVLVSGLCVRISSCWLFGRVLDKGPSPRDCASLVAPSSWCCIMEAEIMKNFTL